MSKILYVTHYLIKVNISAKLYQNTMKNDWVLEWTQNIVKYVQVGPLALQYNLSYKSEHFYKVVLKSDEAIQSY